MKYAALGDTHGNLEALDAVLRDMEQQKPDRIVVLGDTIGYGPNPVECLNKACSIADIFLIGNHEREVVSPEFARFSEVAEESINWTKLQLVTSEEWQKIKQKTAEQGFDKSAIRRHGGIGFVHGSYTDPLDEYVRPWEKEDYVNHGDEVDDYLGKFLMPEELHWFCAHTHMPAVLIEAANMSKLEGITNPNTEYTFAGKVHYFFVPNGPTIVRGLTGKKAVINPGSVGQPRYLGDNRASYVLYDGDSVEFRRVKYNFVKTQKKILALPLTLGTRMDLVDRLREVKAK